MIEIEWDDRRITQALRDLQQATGDLTPAFKEIRERLIESTRKRFETSTGPDGQHWAPNSPVTIANHVHSVGGTKTKDGAFLTKKGERRWDSKKPLIDEGTLMEQIDGDIIDSHTLEIYSIMEYAATQQFGAKQGEFGTSKRGGPLPWGDIPARPFLGISFEDDAEIMSIITKHLENAIK